MKSKLILLPLILCILLVGCTPQNTDKTDTIATEITYSNLSDNETKELARTVMTDAGISAERQKVFFEHLEQINTVVGEEHLTKGFTTQEIATLPTYDPYLLQDLWSEAYPDFMGYNCRITGYGLFGDYLNIDSTAEKRDLFITFDLDSLNNDPSVLVSGDSAEAFSVLYSTIPAEDTTDIGTHVKTVQDDWKMRGVEFTSPENLSLITVFFHDKLSEDECELYIGHVGVLFETESDELYFVEKVAFQEPYQFLKLGSRVELCDYLMGKYDYGEGATAKPFIMENDHLISGYRF